MYTDTQMKLLARSHAPAWERPSATLCVATSGVFAHGIWTRSVLGLPSHGGPWERVVAD